MRSSGCGADIRTHELPPVSMRKIDTKREALEALAKQTRGTAFLGRLAHDGLGSPSHDTTLPLYRLGLVSAKNDRN